MSKFQHSLGNKKINFLKSLSFIFSKLALDFIGLFFKLDKKKSEIIISSSFHAPWKEDLEFLNFGVSFLGKKVLITFAFCNFKNLIFSFT